MTAGQYRIHGMLVDSCIPLDAQEVAGASSVDVRLVRAAAWGTPPANAELIAERRGSRRSSVHRHARGYVLTLSDLCTFVIDPGLGEAQVFGAAGVSDEVLALFVVGSLLPTVLSLRGELVLHASAVLARGGAVAIAGASGAGKSTLAGLACRAGLPFLADDVLRVTRERSEWRAHRGGTAMRLRDSAREVGELAGGDMRRSVDGRHTWAPALRSREDAATLREIFLPRFSDTTSAPVVRPLSRQAAAVELLRNLRMGSWCEGGILERQTRVVAALARDVQVRVLMLPRWEQLGRDAAEALRALLESAG